MFFATPSFNRVLGYGYAPSLQSSLRAQKHVQVESDSTSVTLNLDVPGLSKNHLTIAIEDDVVRIESKADAPRSFKAAYQLATVIDAGASEAKLEDGVLTLKLGKAVPVSKETHLSIN